MAAKKVANSEPVVLTPEQQERQRKLWANRARDWAQKRMDEHFATWCQTDAGKKWKASQSGSPRTKLRARDGLVDERSPYAHGFTVPPYIRRLIRAMNEGDAQTIEAILEAVSLKGTY